MAAAGACSDVAIIRGLYNRELHDARSRLSDCHPQKQPGLGQHVGFSFPASQIPASLVGTASTQWHTPLTSLWI